MATSLLRLGRLGSLKHLLRESWGTQRTQFGAALCTKADAPPKTAKKAKAASKTIKANKRASLLAYKPAVAFPSKLSATGFLPKDIALGESKSGTKNVTSQTGVAAAAATEQPDLSNQSVTEAEHEMAKETEAAEAISTSNVDEMATGIKASDVNAERQQDEDTSSSSSSDSDSDSDSDDEKSEKKPKTETVIKSEGKTTEDKEAPVLTSKQIDVAENKIKSESIISHSVSFGQSNEDAKPKAKPEEMVTPTTKAVGSGESLTDPAPILSSSATEGISVVKSESITVVSTDEMVDTATEVKTAPTENFLENKSETKAEAATNNAHEPVNINTSKGPLVSEVSPIQVSNTAVEASPGVAKAHRDVVIETFQETRDKHECEAGVTGAETAPSEDLKDSAAVVADAETEVLETSEEQAPEKAPEPEPEPFDNTTYKNLQHHQYDMYTFADMDVQMSKHRLPQPSTGRPSPSH